MVKSLKVLSCALLSLLLSQESTSMVQADPRSYYFKSLIDHVSDVKGQDGDRFDLRYIVDDQYWIAGNDNNHSRPIFFYAGNEGDIWNFYKNSGFVTTSLAKEYGALVVFGEHRYFGQSYPFDEEVAFNADNIVHLTLENVFADYIDLLDFIKTKYNAQDKAVIAFGGSYGGMLAAWMRMKHPNKIQGAIAASAPVLGFESTGNDLSGFGNQLYQTYSISLPNMPGKQCADLIKNVFVEINKQTDYDLILNNKWTFCDGKNIKNADDLEIFVSHLQDGFAYMAMADYPYPNSFLMDLPAWPVNKSCDAFADATDPSILYWDEFKKANEVYYGNQCIDLTQGSTGNLGDTTGWDALVCNQLPMPQNNGDKSLFAPSTYDKAKIEADCAKKFSFATDWGYVHKFLGGRNYQKSFRNFDKIVFSNGNLDPWRANGVTDFVSLNIPIYNIRGGAHHLDLRLPNVAETDDVTNVNWVRAQECKLIGMWVNDYQDTNFAEKDCNFTVEPTPPTPPTPETQDYPLPEQVQLLDFRGDSEDDDKFIQ